MGVSDRDGLESARLDIGDVGVGQARGLADLHHRQIKEVDGERHLVPAGQRRPSELCELLWIQGHNVMTEIYGTSRYASRENYGMPENISSRPLVLGRFPTWKNVN